MPSWFIRLFAIIIILALLGLAWFGWRWQHSLYSPLIKSSGAPVVVEITPGTPFISFAWQLKRQGLLQHPKYFIWLAEWRHVVSKVKAGEYLIVPGKTTAAKLLSNMAAGKIYLRQITIVNGWTFQQIMTAVNNNIYLQHSFGNLNHAQIIAKLGYPNVDPEGRFYPDTYLFAKGTRDSKIMQMAYQKMQQTLQQQWQQRAPGLPYTSIDQALIVASLIEKETALEQEKSLIAGVILNRLQKDMRLQIDPTVIYALGNNYQGKLTTQDLKTDLPYNTYTRKGLPPGPIAIPSPSSINAALHPATTNALYYVANGSGGHTFSPTLAEHDQAVKKYLLTVPKDQNATPSAQSQTQPSLPLQQTNNLKSNNPISGPGQKN